MRSARRRLLGGNLPTSLSIPLEISPYTLVAQIKGMMEDLNRFQSILHRLGPAGDAVGIIMKLEKPLSGVNHY